MGCMQHPGRGLGRVCSVTHLIDSLHEEIIKNAEKGMILVDAQAIRPLTALMPINYHFTNSFWFSCFPVLFKQVYQVKQKKFVSA